MPIYAYRCGACGHARDILQKLSDPLLTVCPSCGASAFTKQVTAAGFQLKGSGWYVTDFRDGGKKQGASKDEAANDGKSDAAAPADSSPATAAADAKAGHAGDAASKTPAADGKAAKSDTASPSSAPAAAPPAAGSTS